MEYKRAHASAPLAGYIDSFWELVGSPGRSKSVDSIPPDGHIEIVFNLADPFRRFHSDSRTEIQPKAILVGQMTGPATVEPSGQVALFGFRFRPSGAFPFVRFPLQDLIGKIPSLDSVLGRGGRELEERINLARSFQERVAIAQVALIEMFDEKGARRLAPGFGTTAAVERILASQGCISMDRLASDLGWTGRQLERRFLAQVGIGPKLLSRIVRFQRVFKALDEDPSAAWTSIAYQCGYYDQSHFIRDFKQFAGQIPSAYLQQEREISHYLIKKAPLSDFSNTGA